MKLTTLADVRELMRHLPKGHRARSTWQHVEKQLNAAALSEIGTIDVAVPLQMVLTMEGVEYRVAFWLAPSALLSKKAGAVPELLQVISLDVVVHMNCAEAGELARSAIAETVAAQHSAPDEAKSCACRRAKPRSDIFRCPA